MVMVLLVIGIPAVIALLNAGSALIVNVSAERPDAIVSLASHEWERLPVAAELAHQFPQAQILLTQPPYVSRHNCHDCAHRVDYLASRGIDRRRIVVVPLAESSTWGEARALTAAMRRTSIRRVVLVTSPYHTRRALAVFRSSLAADGITVGVVPAFENSPARPASWWWHPYDRWYVSYEWLAIVTYRIKYGLPVL